MTLRAISELYESGAEIYERLARDRDFARQVGTLVQLLPPPVSRSLRFLELFAGPAAHASAFIASGHGEAFAVDASRAMARLAATTGNPAVSYHISTLPAFPPELNGVRFDLIFAPRYSAGYLSIEALAKMVRHCLPILVAKGLLVLELHDPQLLAGQLRNLGLKERAFTLPDGSDGKVTWPHGEFQFSRNGWTAELTVQIATRGPNADSTSQFSSVEHFHSLELLQFICSEVAPDFGAVALPSMERHFPGSVLVCCGRRRIWEKSLNLA